MLTACRLPGAGSEHCGHWDTHTPGSGERLSRVGRAESVSGGEDGTLRRLKVRCCMWCTACTALQRSAQYNDYHKCQFINQKVKIEDLLITVFFLHKIELSITATNLCITEGCTNRNQPTYYKSILAELCSLGLTGSFLCHENDKYHEKENQDTEDLHH